MEAPHAASATVAAEDPARKLPGVSPSVDSYTTKARITGDNVGDCEGGRGGALVGRRVGADEGRAVVGVAEGWLVVGESVG